MEDEMMIDPLAPKKIGLPDIQKADKILQPYEELGVNPWEEAYISAYEDLRPAIGQISHEAGVWEFCVSTAKGCLGSLKIKRSFNGQLLVVIE
jgi:hypothetical protein